MGEDGELVHNGFGSYTCTFPSGMNYHGKGDLDRARESAVEKLKKYNEPEGPPHIDWKTEKNDRDSFKAEHQRLLNDGTHRSNTNYNQRASPGAKY